MHGQGLATGHRYLYTKETDLTNAKKLVRWWTTMCWSSDKYLSEFVVGVTMGKHIKLRRPAMLVNVQRMILTGTNAIDLFYSIELLVLKEKPLRFSHVLNNLQSII